MSATIFGNAARIIKQVFDWDESSSQTKTNNLIIDTFSSGIDNATLSGEGFLIVPGTNNTSATPTVNCTLESIAYDSTGARIFINSSDTTLYNPTNVSTVTNDGLGNFISTPQSTGVVNIPVTQSSQNYIWVNYLATIDTTAFTLNKITSAKIFYKQTDGYNIQVTTVNVPPNSNSIFLASVNMTGGGAVAPSNISQVGRSYYAVLPNIVPITTPLANFSDRTPQYNPAATYTLEAHIKSVGTGPGISPFNPHNTSLLDLGVSQFDTVQAHRQLEHGTNGSGTDVNNAIIAGTLGNSYPSTSAMACGIAIVSPGSDYVIVRQLLSSEFAIINGTAYNVNAIFGAIPADATVSFPAASGIYNLYWDSVTKSFAVSVAGISTDPTKIWLCTVTYTFVGTGPTDHNALSLLIERRRIGSSTEKYQRWVTTARPNNPLPGEYGFNMNINAPEYFDGNVWQSLTVPTGSMLDFAGVTIPIGFLNCDGSVVSQTGTYANLFAVIGVLWNTGGEGAGNFRLPNFQRRVAVGSGGPGTATLGNTVGNVGGAETHTLINSEVPVLSDPGHFHDVLTTSITGVKNAVPLPDINAQGIAATQSKPDPTSYSQVNEAGTNWVSTGTTGISYGGGVAHSIIQSSAVVTKIIKF